MLSHRGSRARGNVADRIRHYLSSLQRVMDLAIALEWKDVDIATIKAEWYK